MKFGDAGLKLTIGLDQSQLKTITEFIFTQLKDAKEDLQEQIDNLADNTTKEINLLKGKLP